MVDASMSDDGRAARSKTPRGSDTAKRAGQHRSASERSSSAPDRTAAFDVSAALSEEAGRHSAPGGGTKRPADLPPLPPELDPRNSSRRRKVGNAPARTAAAAAPARTAAAPTGPALNRHGLPLQPWAADLDRPTPRRERGLPGWAALLVLIVVAGIGGIIDTATDVQVRGGFNIGIVVASVLAILIVRRSSLLLIVLSPPIVYSGAALFMLYLRSGGLSNRVQVINGALNYLVYGFPAIAAATTAVLLIAVVRQAIKR